MSLAHSKSPSHSDEDSGDDSEDSVESDKDDRKPAAKPNLYQEPEQRPARSVQGNSGLPLWLQRIQASDQTSSNTRRALDTAAQTGQERTLEILEISAASSRAMSLMREIASEEPADKKVIHKQILFGLFSGYRYGERRLESLSRRSGGSSLDQVLRQKYPVQYPSNNKNDALSKIPRAVGFLELLPKETAKGSKPQASIIRAGYAARTFDDIEKETKDWYLSNHSNRRSKKKACCFSLKFNECSIAAISKWAVCLAGAESTNAGSEQEEPSYASLPTVDDKFRQCQTCKLWGHYEIECPEKTAGDDLEYASYAPAIQDTQQHAVNQDPCKKSQVDALVEIQKFAIEECEGFVVEQRNHPHKNPERKMSCPRETRPQYIETPNFYDLSIKAGESPSSFEAKDNHVFLKGDLVAWLSDAVDTNQTTDRQDKREQRINPSAIHVGIVVNYNMAKNSVHVEQLRTILPECDAEASNETFAREDLSPLGKIGASFWMSATKVHLIDQDDESQTGKNRARSSKSQGMKPQAGVGLSHSQQYKRNVRMNHDGTMTPKTMPRKLLDGTYATPKGRQPMGLMWDARRGVWAPPRKKRKKATKK